MKCSILTKFLAWKDASGRKPLILTGVRQVVAGMLMLACAAGVAGEGDKPVIAISGCVIDSRICVKSSYVESVRRAGGVPLIVPVTVDDAQIAAIVKSVDGVVMTGGEDIDPLRWYNEEPLRALGDVSPTRDEFDFKLALETVRRGKPILGICRGHQVLCVAFGGTLYQDIPSQLPKSFVKHRQGNTPRTHGTHTIEIEDGTLLEKLVGRKSIRVNSFHHQAVKKCPAGFKVTAMSKDGIVEGIERVASLTGYADGGGLIMGVQFHPEEFAAFEGGEFLAIFRHLVECARSK